MITRRRFLLLAGSGVAGVVAARFAFARPEQVVAAVVRRKLDYLQLDAAGVDRFAKDFVARAIAAPTKLRALSAVGLIELPIEKLGIHFATLRHGEERILTYYLLSSDFFLNNADESRTVQYLGFYDPYRGACLNPFPRTVPDEDAA
ncbi:MAG: hypothetical protein NVS9B10_20790 [Nevskia sp.]